MHATLTSYTLSQLRNHRSQNSKVAHTHLSLAGGRYVLPDKDNGPLRQALVKDARLGVHNYIVEMRTPIFPFLLDVDLQTSAAVQPEFWRELVQYCMTSVQQFSPPAGTNVCYMTLVEPVQLETGRWKNGMHLYWPELLVNQDTAMQMRCIIIETLTTRYGNPYQNSAWANIIDQSVLTSNGIRFLYHCKARKCVCNRDKKCENCLGTGYLDEGRPYQPKEVFRMDGFEVKPDDDLSNQFTTSYEYAFLKTSVRVLDGRPATVVVPPAMLASIPMPRAVVKKQKTVHEAIGPDGAAKDDFSVKIGDRQHIFEPYSDLNVTAGLLDAINKSGLCPEKQTCQKLKRGTDGQAYLLIGGVNWCNNTPDGPRKHSRQDVFYIVTQTHIRQGCFCGKYEGYCLGHYRSVELHPLDRALLFGKEFIEVAGMAREALQAAARMDMQRVMMSSSSSIDPRQQAFMNLQLVAGSLGTNNALARVAAAVNQAVAPQPKPAPKRKLVSDDDD